MLGAVSVDGALEEGQEIEQRDLREVGLFGLPFPHLDPGGRSAPESEADGFHLVQRLGDALVLAVLEEPPHELVARVLHRLALHGGHARQHHLRLDVEEHRLDVEELGRDLEVELDHEDDVLVVLPADVGHGKIPEVDLVPADEVEEEVQRPLEHRQLHRVRLHEVRAGRDGDADAFSHAYSSPIASETFSIVSEAIFLALSFPASRTSLTYPGFATISARFWRAGSIAAFMLRMRCFLQSTQPRAAVRHSRSTCFCSSGGE